MFRLGGVLKTPEQTVSPSLVQVTDTSSGQKSLMHSCSVHSSFSRGHGGSQSMNLTLGGVPVQTHIGAVSFNLLKVLTVYSAF